MFQIRENLKKINEVENYRNYLLINWLVIFGLNLNTSIFFLYPLELGLSFAEMMFVYFTLTRIVYLLIIIPSGVIADKYSVKYCIIFTIFLFSIAYFGRGYLPFMLIPMAGFIISEILMGIADAFWIGAKEKYQYSFSERIADSQIFSIDDTVVFFLRAIATLVGGLIVHFGSMRWTQIVGGVIIFLGFLLSIKYIKEPKYEKDETTNGLGMYKKGLKYVVDNKKILFYVIGTSLVGLGVFASRNVFQPLLNDLGLNIDNFAIAFGLVFTIQMIFSSIGSYVVPYLNKKMKLSMLIFFNLVLMGLFLFSISIFKIVFIAILFIWIFALLEGSFGTQSKLMINRLIEKEDIRATVNSISSFASALILVVMMPIIGSLTDTFGKDMNLYISSVLVVLGGLILYMPYYLNNKNKRS